VILLLAILFRGFCHATFDKIINWEGPYISSNVVSKHISTLGYITHMGAFLVLSFSFWESSMHKEGNRKMPSERHFNQPHS
jgi:hypothetical protein